MMKRIILSLTLIIFFSLGLGLTLKAQKKLLAADYAQEPSLLPAKTAALPEEWKSANKEILKKLDRVLSNQEKIFSELAIIKVRASKR